MLGDWFAGQIPEADLPDVIKSTALSRLWLLPAGQMDTHAVQALAQEGLGTMFEHLKEEYDFIIVDSVPVLPLADALLTSQHVDAVLFSIMRDVSRLPMVHGAYERLSSLGLAGDYALPGRRVGASVRLSALRKIADGGSAADLQCRDRVSRMPPRLSNEEA